MVLQKAPNSNKPISRTCAVLFLRHMAFYSGQTGGITWNTVRSHGAGICLCTVTVLKVTSNPKSTWTACQSKPRDSAAWNCWHNIKVPSADVFFFFLLDFYMNKSFRGLTNANVFFRNNLLFMYFSSGRNACSWMLYYKDQ